MSCLVTLVSCEEKFSQLKTHNFNSTLTLSLKSIFGALDEAVSEDANLFGKCSGRVTDQNCVGFQKSIKYKNCEINNVSLTGMVELDYNQEGCQFDGTNQTVRRSLDVKQKLKNGKTIESNSMAKTTYSGELLMGGERIQRMQASWWYENLGKEIIARSKEGKLVLSLLLKTSDPIVITQGLERGARKIQSGSWKVYNNLEKFTLKLTPKNLTFKTECCHPVAGEIEIELNSGQKDQFVDKSKLQYIGCAKARLLKQGKETELSLKACLL
tara:strand:+ start:10573 stop:11382 length:810 start_codon:yes stop_codon:yes gene_type:complete